MSEDYGSHARRLQERAEAEHRKWVAGLTPAQKAKLKSMGVFDAPDDRHEVGGHSPHQACDIADTPLARTEADPAGELDSEAAILADRFHIDLELAEHLITWRESEIESALRQREGDLLSIVIGGLIASKNPRVSAAALAFAAGLAAVNGLGSQSEFARRLKISRATISKMVKSWQRSLNLRPSVHQKSEPACKSYSENGKKNHWRSAKVTASSLLKKLSPLRTTTTSKP
jgi:DNA-binding MarR family transcriptional regulator